MAAPLCVAFAVLAASSAHVASAASVSPGAVQQTVQPDKAIPIDRSVQVPELRGGAARPANVPPGGTPIAVTRFDFTGNTKVDSAELQQQVAKYLGKSLTLADLYKVTQDLTRFYQAKGYTLSSVNLPVQRIDNGRVWLEVLEGKVGKVRVEGYHYYKGEALQERLNALAGGTVVTRDTLVREVLLLNDMPGIEARIVVVPGTDPQTSDLVVKVTEDGFDQGISVDNYGRDQIGETRFNYQLSINGMGRGDQLTLGLTHSAADLLNYGRLGYSLPLGDHGARLGMSVYGSFYTVEDPNFPLLDVEGSSRAARIDYSFPLERSRRSNRVLSVGLSTTTTQTSTLSITTSHVNTSLLDVTLFGNGFYDGGSSYDFQVGFSGNGEYNDGGEDGNQLAKLTASYAFNQPIGGSSWTSRTRLRAVYSFGEVADIEKMSLGGPFSVRGYDQSELRGDKGIEMTQEYLRQMPILGKSGALVFFADAGVVSSHVGGQAPLVGSVGGAVRVYDLYGFECNLQWALPVGGYDPADGERSGRAWLSVGARF
jgi:hemolysin activation/secretion protein